MRRALLVFSTLVGMSATGYAVWLVAEADLLGKLQGSTPGIASKPSEVRPRASSRAVEQPVLARLPQPLPTYGDTRGRPDVARPAITPGRTPSRGPLAIEVARIEADGVSVLAGRAPPGSRVSIIANGRAVASAVASADGQWSAVVSGGIPAGSLALNLTAQPADGSAPMRGATINLEVAPAARVAGLPAANKPLSTAAAKPASHVRPASAPSPAAATSADRHDLATFEALVGRAREEKAKPQVRVAATAAQGPVGEVDAYVPVPITFESNAETMTDAGRKAAELLVEYLALKQPRAITLSGHADSRGTDAYNMELSRRRLEAIERYLRHKGYSGRLALVPKGKREPYSGVDRDVLSRDAILQADRRVELRMTP